MPKKEVNCPFCGRPPQVPGVKHFTCGTVFLFTLDTKEVCKRTVKCCLSQIYNLEDEVWMLKKVIRGESELKPGYNLD